jgi:hypothetical protein
LPDSAVRRLIVSGSEGVLAPGGGRLDPDNGIDF